MAGSRLSWQRGNGRVVEEVLLHGMTAPENAVGSIGALRIAFVGTSHEIEWIAEQSAEFSLQQRHYLEAISL